MPWRGPLVVAADAGFTQGNRQAALFLYAGILADEPGPGPSPSDYVLGYITRNIYDSISHVMAVDMGDTFNEIADGETAP